MTPVIRDFVPADAPAVLELWRETGLSSPHRADTPETIARTLAAGGRLLVLEADGVLVGTSWLTVDGRRASLHHLGIRPSHQRRGLGRQLLEASLAAARAIGLQVKLEVHRDNAAAIALYRLAGFIRLGDYDVYIMRDLPPG
ncbi:MAG: GNAT family N-acetyltransferase [Deltaproteobacteria bacterium]|nr:GNAT family N-acetyltransferase [Deltaproteobacteria bacterium]